jgi:phage-related protein
MEIRFYKTDSGRMPVFEYLSSLPKEEKAAVFSLLNRISNHGHAEYASYLRHIDGKLWEIKIRSHRIFYVFEKQMMILCMDIKSKAKSCL